MVAARVYAVVQMSPLQGPVSGGETSAICFGGTAWFLLASLTRSEKV